MKCRICDSTVLSTGECSDAFCRFKNGVNLEVSTTKGNVIQNNQKLEDSIFGQRDRSYIVKRLIGGN